MDTKSAQIVIVIVYGNKNKKPLHAKTIRLGSGTCLGPTQRPEEQGQPLRKENFIKRIVFFLNQTQRPEEQEQLLRGRGETFKEFLRMLSC